MPQGKGRSFFRLRAANASLEHRSSSGGAYISSVCWVRETQKAEKFDTKRRAQEAFLLLWWVICIRSKWQGCALSKIRNEVL